MEYTNFPKTDVKIEWGKYNVKGTSNDAKILPSKIRYHFVSVRTNSFVSKRIIKLQNKIKIKYNNFTKTDVKIEWGKYNVKGTSNDAKILPSKIRYHFVSVRTNSFVSKRIIQLQNKFNKKIMSKYMVNGIFPFKKSIKDLFKV